MEDYKINHNANQMKPKKGRPMRYWDMMLDCKELYDSFYVARSYQTMNVNCWRYNKEFAKVGSKWRFKPFKDSELRCKACGHIQLHSQMKGSRCIECNETKGFRVKTKGCSVQRIA